MDYVRIEPKQLPIGGRAVVIASGRDGLEGAVLEHSADGRMRRKPAVHEGERSVIDAFTEVIAGRRDADHVCIVLEADAPWPEVFPPLRDLRAA